MSAHAAFAGLKELGLEPVLKAALEKARLEDGVKGTIKVPLSRSQKDELEGLVRLPRSSSALVSVDLVKLDAALRRSKFRAGLVEVLEAGYGPLVTRRQERENQAARWKAWLVDCGHNLPDAAAPWFEGITDGTTPSGRWARRSYLADPAQAAQVVRAVGRALACLPADSGSREPLALFAATITDDPHSFDGDRPGGRLLLHALAERYAPPQEVTDRELRTFLLDMAGLGIDQVSSTVLVAHLEQALVGNTVHPVVAAMGEYGGGWRITLGEVMCWSQASGRCRRAYAVENPPVFEYLLSQLESLPVGQRPTLICTEGFFSAAAVRLLDLLAANGTKIMYSGDFDRNGLAIADWVVGRYPGVSRPWRMDVASYGIARSEQSQPMEQSDRDALLAMTGELAETAEMIANHGVTYQERLVECLLGDIGPSTAPVITQQGSMCK